MPKLRHLEGSALAPSYSGGSQCKDFRCGEVREVSQELADYLVGTFPGCFAVVKSRRPKSASVAAPSKTAAVKSPVKRKAPAKRKASIKKADK